MAGGKVRQGHQRESRKREGREGGGGGGKGVFGGVSSAGEIGLWLKEGYEQASVLSFKISPENFFWTILTGY